jgi:DNA modification methylase
MLLNELKLNPDNPRTIKKEKLEKLAQSIKDFPKMMIKRPIVYDENKVIIGGNMRYRAIQSLGMTEIPDEWTSDASDFTPEERHRFIMQDNAEMGEHDWDLVANQYELEDLEAWGIDVPYADSDTEVEEDEAPEVSSEPPVSQLGSIYQLGRHRVMCGDSTKIEDVEKLMNGQKADMVFTDPPYGMGLEADFKWSKGNENMGIKPSKGYDQVIGDEKQFNYQEYEWLECKEQFWWGADYYVDTLPNCGKEGSWFVWDKKNDSLKDVWTNEFELLWSKVKHKKQVLRVLWNGALGTESEDVKNRVHPTQKPIRVCTPVIEQYSKNDDIVLDLFGGSGSTLIACEQTDRTCYDMELDPKYVDVIRKRYWKFVNNNDETGWEENTPAIAGEKRDG